MDLDKKYLHSNKDLYLIKNKRMSNSFPNQEDALDNPNGLLAIGGDLSEKRLLNAYQKGIFPWFNLGQPILWWSPNPRCVLIPKYFHISRTLRRKLNNNIFSITYNKEFKKVMHECSINRVDDNTWITPSIKHAFFNLYKSGYAHSVECWENKKLVGGLYGVVMGKIFFGESMYSRVSDASKILLAHLMDRLESLNFRLLDCQIESDHLKSLGAQLFPRKKFNKILNNHCNLDKTYFS